MRTAPGSAMISSTIPRRSRSARKIATLGRARDILLGRLAPQNRRASFGRDDRVAGVLLDQHDVGDAERERAAGSAFAYHARNRRHVETRHQLEVVRDRLGLSALFGAHARLRALRIDKCDEREPETIGELVNPRRFAIALGMRLAKVALDAIGGRAPALLADNRYRNFAPKVREARDDRAVIGKAAVAMNLEEILEQPLNVVERLRPSGCRARRTRSIAVRVCTTGAAGVARPLVCL